MGRARPQKLERIAPYYAMKSDRDDTFSLWNPFGQGIESQMGVNLSLTDSRGESVLTIYGLKREQYANLYTAIGDLLGVAPNVTVAHLEQLHRHLGDLLGERRREQERLREQFMEAGGGMEARENQPPGSFDPA